MNEGLLIFVSLSLLFIGMFVYSYGTEYLNHLKEQRHFKLQLEHEAELTQQKLLKEQLRQEKFLKLKQRSDAIKQEFQGLAEFRSKVLTNRISNKKTLA